jgi:F-type H+-transporting ATPase subunit gamma
MSAGIAGLRHKIDSAGDLQAVVRTMKALAASNIGQYEQSVQALADYYRTVELGLGVCLRAERLAALAHGSTRAARAGVAQVIRAVVFGSDQGLVGQFNDVIADHAIQALATLPGKVEVWAVGERVQARLVDAGLTLRAGYGLPSSVKAIAPLIARIQIETEDLHGIDANACLYVFHTRPRLPAQSSQPAELPPRAQSAAGPSQAQPGVRYEPVTQRLLPLDAQWLQSASDVAWPGKLVPETLADNTTTLRALIREYLYISLFRACAESLASENASRLAAMERADKNIDELLGNLHGSFHRLRQNAIDEELFDVVSGYEALGPQGDAGREG